MHDSYFNLPWLGLNVGVNGIFRDLLKPWQSRIKIRGTDGALSVDARPKCNETFCERKGEEFNIGSLLPLVSALITKIALKESRHGTQRRYSTICGRSCYKLPLSRTKHDQQRCIYRSFSRCRNQISSEICHEKHTQSLDDRGPLPPRQPQRHQPQTAPATKAACTPNPEPKGKHQRKGKPTTTETSLVATEPFPEPGTGAVVSVWPDVPKIRLAASTTIIIGERHHQTTTTLKTCGTECG